MGRRNEPGVSPAWVVEVESMVMTSWPLRVVGSYHSRSLVVARGGKGYGRRLTRGKSSSGGAKLVRKDKVVALSVEPCSRTRVLGRLRVDEVRHLDKDAGYPRPRPLTNAYLVTLTP
jgi:hypothetical protein